MTVSAFFAADVGRDIVGNAGMATITGYTDAQHVTVDIKQEFPQASFGSGDWTIVGTPKTTCATSSAGPAGVPVNLTLGLAGWRVEDVGKFVRMNGGLVQITAYTSATIVVGRIFTEMTSAVTAEKDAWSLEGSMWGGRNGYPRCGTLEGQRLWLAGSPGFPEGFWGSTIGVYFDYTLGVFDDEAMAYTIAGDEFNPIQHLANAGGLVALTSGGEFSIRGGQEKPITPTNLQVKQQSNFGCSKVPPVRVGSELYLTQRAGRKIRALAPSQFDSEQYQAPDMSVLSEHVTQSGVVDAAFQQEPSSILYLVREDGQMATLTVDRDQDVIAWARQVTNGNFESVASIPTPTGDAVFLSVARVINGQTVRYTEMLDASLGTDCALTGHSDAGATVWTGLGHLEGRTVNVKGDGVVLVNRVVSGGSITVERAVFDIEIGLNYTTTIVTLTPEVAGPVGSSQGSALSINEVIVRLRDTIGCDVNYQKLPFKKLGLEVLDKSPEPFTGDKAAGNLGWANGVAQTIITQSQPYPFHLLAVITKLTVNDG